MAQSRAAYTYAHAQMLREQLIDAYAEADGRGDFSRSLADDLFRIENHTVWRKTSDGEREPNEYSSLEVHQYGEGGIDPRTIKALAEVGFGVSQPLDNKYSEGFGQTNVYVLSSYGRHDGPAWDWANPSESGIDRTRPDNERDDDVDAWLRTHESNCVPPRSEQTEDTDEADEVEA